MYKIRQISLFAIVICTFYCGNVIAQSENKDYQYALIEAVKQKNIGNLPGAIELYKMVIEANETVAVAYYELGTLYAMIGDEQRARFNLQKAYSLDPENKWYFESYMDFLMNGADLKLAEKLLKSKLRKHPENIDYQFRLANVYFNLDKSRKAIKSLNQIEKKHGVSDRITLMKANMYEQEGKFEKALLELQKVLNLFPESIEFKVVAAELALKSKNEDLAADYYKDVFELDSLNIFAITNLTDYYRENDKLADSFYFLNKSFESDEISFDKKIAILSYYLTNDSFYKNNIGLLEPLIKTLQNKYPDKHELNLIATDYYVQNRKYDDALNAILPLLNEKENKYKLWRQGILLANATNRIENMYEISSAAYLKFPDSMEVVFFKGASEFELEKYDGVTETFTEENLNKIYNKEIYSQSRIMLAESYHNLENYPVADSLFRRIIIDEPTNYLVSNNFSYYLSIRDTCLEEARALSLKTIEADPENGTFIDTYAWILFKLKRYEEAENYIRKALKYGGENDPDVNEHAAEINLALGSIDLAISFLQKAILLGGDKEQLIEKLNEIQKMNAL